MAFEDVPGTGGSAVPVAGLRLTRLGTQVAFHVEPRTGAFGPGSLLYFVAGGTDAAHGSEAVYELARAGDGVRMSVDVAAARGGASAAPAVTDLRHAAAFEQDVNYLPALLESRDLWTWDYGLAGGQSASYPFKIQDLTLAPEAARLVVDLEGGSDTVTDPDHHVRVFVNGSLVGEATWDGMRPATLEVGVPVALLRPGDNALLLENAGDTGSVQSFVYLDRFSIEYPREIVPVDGVVEGVAPSSGRVGREAAPGTVLLDVTSPVPAWLGRVHALGQAGFRAEAGHRYLMVAPEAVARPAVRPAPATTLRSATNQADWLLIGPRDLLPAAEALVAHRQAQGLAARAVALEDVVDEFGYGESGPHAVRAFLAFAFQAWARPSVRYVVLLGDATYDPKGRLSGTSRPDALPAPLTRSTFLWTASDPVYAATNGEDLLPDLALGRLSAATLAEAQAAVQKILDFETAGLGPRRQGGAGGRQPGRGRRLRGQPGRRGVAPGEPAGRADLPRPGRLARHGQGGRDLGLRHGRVAGELRRPRVLRPLGDRGAAPLARRGGACPPAPPAPRPDHDLLERVLPLPLLELALRAAGPDRGPGRHRRVLAVRAVAE